MVILLWLAIVHQIAGQHDEIRCWSDVFKDASARERLAAVSTTPSINLPDAKMWGSLSCATSMAEILLQAERQRTNDDRVAVIIDQS